jgi:hypothetical protein
VLVGVWIVALGVGDARRYTKESRFEYWPHNPLVLTPAISISVGLASILIGAMSFIYHASYSKLGGALDIGAMHILIMQLNGAIATRFLPLKRDLERLRVLSYCIILIASVVGLGLCVKKVIASVSSEGTGLKTNQEVLISIGLSTIGLSLLPPCITFIKVGATNLTSVNAQNNKIAVTRSPQPHMCHVVPRCM